MQDVSELFKVNANTVYEIFTHKNLTTGILIPEYQRVYSWDTKNIDRLIDDIREGILGVRNDRIKNESITFVGTIICSKLSYDGFEGDVLSIVDGQQRLTTLILICLVLHNKISSLTNNFEIDSSEELTFIYTKVVKAVLNKLYVMIAGQYVHLPSSSDDMFPRIVREEHDRWSQEPRSRYYISPTAKLLFNYIERIQDNKENNVSLELESGNNLKESNKYFTKNLNAISENLHNISLGQPFGSIKKEGLEVEPIPEARDILLNPKYRTALLVCASPIDDAHASRITDEISSCGEEIDQLFRLVAFANYLISRVAVTRVIATSDNYAFDIFEALNTAGEPLTALETFKPIVFREEEKEKEGFARSDSKLVFESLRSYLENDEFDTAEKRQRESKEIVVQLALLIDGRKESLHLNSQRKYLRTRYEKLKGIEEKKRFVKEIDSVLKFRSELWRKNNKAVLFPGEENRELLLFCIDFIRDMKTSMATPILTRYFEDSHSAAGYSQFLSAVKMTTAFLVLWRAYYGGTHSIDSKFRSLMSTGFCKGKHLSNKLPSIEQLKSVYQGILSKKENLLDRKVWVQGVCSQPLYTRSKPLCRFLLILSSNNTELVAGEKFILKKGRKNSSLNLIHSKTWDSPEFSTLEHIAPQNPELNSSWDKNIFRSPHLVNSIGNLILIPQKENSSVGNLGWDIKKVYYSAFSETDHDRLQEHVSEARVKGFNIRKSTVDMIQNGECLPILKNISSVRNWDESVINQRSANIAELIWDEMSDWLNSA